jgi:DNA-binding XRE family transcriptional regulator
MRTVKRIIKIHQVDGYKVWCLFNNGQSRIIDFEEVFRKWNVKAGDLEFILATSLGAFQQIELQDGTFVWKNVELESTDEDGKPVKHSYECDPIVMYEMSKPDPTRGMELGLMIRQARMELGLTQEELAEKSGTTKHYISKIENNKTGIELSTLSKIIEGGLGKSLRIEIV